MAVKPAAPPSHGFLHIFFFFLLALFPLNSSLESNPENQKELQILLGVKDSWGNPPSLQALWNLTTRHCNWTGVRCSGGGLVTGIFLSNLSISAPIPTAICDLHSLSHLDVSFNNIPGGFPTVLYNCSSLEFLDISQNYFVGLVPGDVDRLSRELAYLSLSANNFTGDLPPAIGRLPSVKTLLLDNNLFNGTVAAALGNLSTLETLWLAYNPFAPSSIPPEFGNLTALSYLWMTSCNLVGEIPEFFGKLAAMNHLDLAINRLAGNIPAGIWMLENLEFLFLYHNSLSGEINGTIGTAGLVSIDVSMNNISGSIPEGFGSLQNLTALAMYYNQLSGEIPVSIGRLPGLINVRLFNNQLTGSLPPELGKFSKLSNFEASNNMISGELPELLCAGGSLTSVVVFGNNLTGGIPASLSECTTLNNFQIYSNQISGDVPTGFWSLPNLTTVIVHDNSLTGELPAELPPGLSRLDIGNNRLSGQIPTSSAGLQVFRADHNLFSGEIPQDLSGISSLQILSLRGNRISGNIPPGIAALRGINVLDLGTNELAGEIPQEIGSLRGLTYLDLSSNLLSGEIPPEIGDLKLSFLNLSSNNLSGQIPSPLQNQAYDHSFVSNPGLCSVDSSFNLRPCTSTTKTSTHFPAVAIAMIALGLLSLTAAITAVTIYRRRTSIGKNLTTWKLTPFQSSAVSEVAVARGITEENLIGFGGTGRVYRVAVGGDIVAVKKIWNVKKLDSKMEKQFLTEVEILGSIRHANIVKLLCCISSPDSKLLVYEYMCNGSLYAWLHDMTEAAVARRALDWLTRLAIAVGAARGLCYMHHDCSPPVIHRDVKSSNILLDSEFNTKIADFGLARLLVRAGEPDTVSDIAGSFGYMAPECGYTRKVDEKVDVYSFGVVLLELLTGKEAGDGGGKHSCLADHVWRHYKGGKKMMEVIDKAMKDDCHHLEEIEAVLKLALVCTGSLPSSRPTMKEVLQILLRCSQSARSKEKPPAADHDVAPLLQQPKKGSHRRLAGDEDFYCNV